MCYNEKYGFKNTVHTTGIMFGKKIFLALALCVVAVLNIAATTTEDVDEYDWVKYVSDTGIFETVVPDRAKTKITKLRIDPDKPAYSEETVATLDQRPYKNAMKNYIIRFDQTLGPPMNDEEREKLMEQEVNSYVEYYTAKGGTIEDKTTSRTSATVRTVVSMTYKDEDMGQQGLKLRMEFSEFTRLQQVMTGPKHVMDTQQNKNFFNYFKMNGGLAYAPGKYEDEWDKHTSPLKIFSVLLPPVAEPYVQREPVTKHSDDAEKMSFVFTDPVRAQKIFYDIYGFRTEENLNYADAEELLLKRIVSQHLKRLDNVSLRRTTAGNLPGIEIDYKVPPHKKFPFVEVVKLRCLFIKNYMVVQQVIASDLMMNSNFVQNFLQQIEFHPKDAHVDYMKTHKDAAPFEEEAGEAPAAGD
jgi:hypothetical protein